MKKTAIITILVLIVLLCGAEKGTDLESLDLRVGAENYLRRGVLSDAQIEKIEAYLCGTME